MSTSAVSSYMPTISFPSSSQILRNANTLAITTVALVTLANLPGADAGLVGGLFAGLGTALVGSAMIVTGVILSPTGVGVGLVTAGAVVVAKAPVVGAVVGLTPTP